MLGLPPVNLNVYKTYVHDKGEPVLVAGVAKNLSSESMAI
jgi:hypothetical protein